MLVLLTSAIMDCGVHRDAGSTMEVDAARGADWISRGLAAPAEAPVAAPPAKRDPIAAAQLAELQPALAPTLPAPPEPAAEEPPQEPPTRRRRGH